MYDSRVFFAGAPPSTNSISSRRSTRITSTIVATNWTGHLLSGLQPVSETLLATNSTCRHRSSVSMPWMTCPPRSAQPGSELPATSYWQGIGFDTRIADAEAATLFNGARALRMGASLPGPVEAVYVRLSESIRDDTLLPAVSITGPDGPLTVQAIEEVKSHHDDGVSSWESVEGYRIRFAPQATEGEYTVRIAPTVADAPNNRLDGSDEDSQGGEPEDAYEGTFRIVPVQVFGAVDLNSDVLTTPHSGGFGIALWEKVGARDPVPGCPQAGDQPDYVVSLTNDLTGNRYTTLSFVYAFTKDLSGQPIQNQDPREGNGPRELYVTLLGQHATGAFVDPDTITTQDHSGDPLWVALHPLPLSQRPTPGMGQDPGRRQIGRTAIFDRPDRWATADRHAG